MLQRTIQKVFCARSANVQRNKAYARSRSNSWLRRFRWQRWLERDPREVPRHQCSQYELRVPPQPDGRVALRSPGWRHHGPHPRQEVFPPGLPQAPCSTHQQRWPGKSDGVGVKVIFSCSVYDLTSEPFSKVLPNGNTTQFMSTSKVSVHKQRVSHAVQDISELKWAGKIGCDLDPAGIGRTSSKREGISEIQQGGVIPS